MFDIIDKFNVLQLCFNKRNNIVNQPSIIGEKCVDSGFQPKDGSTMQSHYSWVHSHDGATTKANDGNIVVF
jgi:hypothetical protein